MTQPDLPLVTALPSRNPLDHWRPGPAARAAAPPPPYTTREILIQQIRDLACWYEDNPDEPMPQYIIASSSTYDTGHNDEPDRVVEVIDFANRHEAELHETWGEVTARVSLFTSAAMNVVVRRSTTLDPTVGRYVR